MSYIGRVVIYGGKGALGSKCVSHFKANQFWVASVDFAENDEAHCNVVVNKDQSFVQQEENVLNAVSSALNGNKLDGVFCVAGGWAGGNAQNEFAKTTELMWKQSVCTSVISATIAANFLKEGAVLALTGAKAAMKPTPGMISYGLAKCAVHHMTQSLAREGSGMPPRSIVAAILPITLDTPMNRRWMPNADHSTWTPLEFVADVFLKWTVGNERPKNGSLLEIKTVGGESILTKYDYVEGAMSYNQN